MSNGESVQKTLEAAKAIGAKVAFPIFKNPNQKMPDGSYAKSFNDLGILEGPEEVKRQLKEAKSPEEWEEYFKSEEGKHLEDLIQFRAHPGSGTYNDIEKHLKMLDEITSDLVTHTNHLDLKLNSDVKYLMDQIKASENECKRLIHKKDHDAKKWLIEKLWQGFSIIGVLSLTLFLVFRSLNYWFY